MCEATAYLLKDDQEELVLESVDLLAHEDDHIKMVNIFGEQKILRPRLNLFPWWNIK